MQTRPSRLVLNTGSLWLLAGEHGYTTPASITYTPHLAPHARRALDDGLNPHQCFSYSLSQKLSHSTEEEVRFVQTGSSDARNQTRLCVSKASALPTLLPSPPTRAGEAWKEGRSTHTLWPRRAWVCLKIPFHGDSIGKHDLCFSVSASWFLQSL